MRWSVEVLLDAAAVLLSGLFCLAVAWVLRSFGGVLARASGLEEPTFSVLLVMAAILSTPALVQRMRAK